MERSNFSRASVGAWPLPLEDQDGCSGWIKACQCFTGGARVNEDHGNHMAFEKKGRQIYILPTSTISLT